MIKKIGIFKLSALGDILWTLPALQFLRKSDPSCQILWWVDKAYLELLEPFAKSLSLELRTIDKPKSLTQLFNTAKKLKQETDKEALDILLCAQTSLRSNLLYPFIKAKQKIGLNPLHARDGHRFFVHKQAALPPESSQVHLVDALISMVCEALKLPPLNRKAILQLDFRLALDQTFPLDFDQVDQVDQEEALIIHPCASHPRRSWPPKRWQELIQSIQKHFPNLKIMMTGSPQDKEFIEAILHNLSSGKIDNLSGKLNLKQLAELYSKPQIKALISVDTGPIHLGNAQGLPCIGLYGAVPSCLTGPYHFMDYCIDHYPYPNPNSNPNPNKASFPRIRGEKLGQVMESISVQEVMEKLTLILSKEK